MATFDESPYVGARLVAFSAAELLELHRAGPAVFPSVNLDKLKHLGTFAVALEIAAAVDNATVAGGVWEAKFPVKVIHMDASVESAAGSAATLDVHLALAATPTTFATMTLGAVDVKTGVPYPQALPFTSGKENLEVGDRLKAVAIGTGSGAVVGSKVIVYLQRR